MLPLDVVILRCYELIFSRRLRRWNGETSWIFSAGEREGEKDGGGEEDELIDREQLRSKTEKNSEKLVEIPGKNTEATTTDEISELKTLRRFHFSSSLRRKLSS